MGLKNIAIIVVVIEIALIVLIFLLFIIFRILNIFLEKRKINNSKKLFNLILTHLINKTPLDFKKEKPEKLVNRQDFLKIMEALNKSISSQELNILNHEVSHHYFLGFARRLANDSSWENRNFAARCFSLFHFPSDTSTIIKLIDDPSFLVNSIAAATAVKFELKDGIFKIIKRMSIEGGYARFAYQDILTRGSIQSFLWIQEFAASEKDPLIRRACLDLLASRQVIITHSFLREATNSTAPLIRLAAVKLFAHNLQKDSDAILFRFMDDKSEEIRVQAAYGLGFFKTDKNIKRLILALNEESWGVRKQAVESLKKMGQKGMDALRNYDFNSNEKVYETIKYVLEFDR